MMNPLSDMGFEVLDELGKPYSEITLTALGPGDLTEEIIRKAEAIYIDGKRLMPIKEAEK